MKKFQLTVTSMMNTDKKKLAEILQLPEDWIEYAVVEYSNWFRLSETVEKLDELPGHIKLRIETK